MTEKEKAIARALERRKAKEKRELLKNTKFPVDIRPTTAGDVFNDYTSSIQAMANPALRLMERATGTGYFDDVMRKQQESVARGRRVRQDWPGLLRSGGYPVGDPVGEIAGGIALTKGQGVAPTAMGRIAQAGVGGAALGPAFAPTDVPTLEAMNEGAKWGLLMGPAFELGGKAFQAGDNLVRRLIAGDENRAGHMLSNALGNKKQAVISALRNNKSRVKGEKPTAGEVAAPVGSTEMSSIQKMVERVEPTKYSDINKANEAARLAAIKKRGGDVKMLESNRTIATTPMRESALSKAAPIEIDDIAAVIDDRLSDKMVSTIERRSLEAIKKNIAERAEDGFISPDALYTVRKEIGNVLESTFAKEGIRWDKASSGGIQRKIQGFIDDAIEAAGGEGWREYLREFSGRSKQIENVATANKLAGQLGGVAGDEMPKAFLGAANKAPIKSAQLQSSVDDVSDSLLRNRQMEAQARMGVTATREKINLPRLPNTGMFAPTYQVFKSVVNKFTDRATKGVMQELADSFDDPGKVLVLLSKTDIPIETQRMLYALSKQAQPGAAAALAAEYSGDKF